MVDPGLATDKQVRALPGHDHQSMEPHTADTLTTPGCLPMRSRELLRKDELTWANTENQNVTPSLRRWRCTTAVLRACGALGAHLP